MSPQEKLRRQVSSLYSPGGDPYNTADTIKLSQQLVLDFVEWAHRAPPEPGLPLEGALLRRQAG